MKLQGIFVPITTPFDHNGELYKAKLKHNLEKWNLAALAGYVVCGSTGEGPMLTADEKVRVWGWAAEYSAPGRLLIAGIRAESVRETVSLANRAAEIGYKAVLAPIPRSCESIESQTLYFRAVADQSQVPVLVSGAQVAAAELSQHPNIEAVALESGDAEAVAKLKPFIQVLAASEAVLWHCLAAGAVGAVLPYANAAPYSAITIWEAHRSRDAEAGLDWQKRIAHAAHLVTAAHGIPGLKYAMDLNDYYGGPCRLPLAPLSPDAKREIEAAFQDLRG